MDIPNTYCLVLPTPLSTKAVSLLTPPPECYNFTLILASIYLLHLDNPSEMVAKPEAGPEGSSFIHRSEDISSAIAPVNPKLSGVSMILWEQ